MSRSTATQEGSGLTQQLVEATHGRIGRTRDTWKRRVEGKSAQWRYDGRERGRGLAIVIQRHVRQLRHMVARGVVLRYGPKSHAVTAIGVVTVHVPEGMTVLVMRMMAGERVVGIDHRYGAGAGNAG